MFLDFAILTDQQGELLDRIEYQVKNTAEDINHANVDLVTSIGYQQEILQRNCLILLIVLVIAGIIVGVVVGELKTK